MPSKTTSNFFKVQAAIHSCGSVPVNRHSSVVCNPFGMSSSHAATESISVVYLTIHV